MNDICPLDLYILDYLYILCKTKYKSTKLHSCKCTGGGGKKTKSSSCPTLLYIYMGNLKYVHLIFIYHGYYRNNQLHRKLSFKSVHNVKKPIVRMELKKSARVYLYIYLNYDY